MCTFPISSLPRRFRTRPGYVGDELTSNQAFDGHLTDHGAWSAASEAPQTEVEIRESSGRPLDPGGSQRLQRNMPTTL